MKRLRLFCVLMIVALFALAGSTFAQDEMEPQSGGTLNAAWQAEWETLDPHIASTGASNQILNNVLETLTWLDDDLNVIPWLAESWEQSEDGLTWTFHLRHGVMFSNGDEMTSADVKWTFDRILDPATGSGNAFRVGPEGTTVDAPDDYTVVITHPEVVSILPAQLASNKFVGIMHPDSLEDDGFVRMPIGTGPFAIAEVEGTNRVRLERNENYWQEGLPYLDAIEISPIPDETAREAALVGGEVQWVQSVPPQNIEGLESNDDIVVGTANDLAYDYFGFNMTREPFDNLQVRQAIATAIDRQMICDFAFFGVCTPVQGPTGPGSPWFIDYTPYDQNLDRARELLAEAGYADGFEMSFMVSGDFPETVRAAQVLQQQLAAINIDISIDTVEFSEWLDRQASGDFDTFMLSWIALTDGNDYFYLQHRTGQLYNATGFSDPEFDALVDQARSISDFDARYALYEQANQILVDAAPYVYMYSKQLIQAYSADVHGYVVRSDGAVNFGIVWLSDGM